MARRRTTSPRFQHGINPFSGLNQRDFCAGGYDHEVAHQLVREQIEAVLVPSGYTLDDVNFRRQAGSPWDPIVRLVITPPGMPQETHDVRVEDEGVRPWAGRTGLILVAWVKEHYDL